MADLYAAVYNPDVLSCLANLSSDEVFTPPEMANQVLDMLPESLWSDPNARFLDPCSKTGVFLREIAKRLIRAQMPDFDQCMTVIDYKRANGEELSAVDKSYLERLQPVLDHIFREQLYGIGITQLTALMTRRSLYCSKWANGPYSVVEFDSSEGNIRYRNLQHSWEGPKGRERCKYCGASKRELDENRSSDESHAYELIHTWKPERIFNNMQFDVIVGNPPYQMSDGGNAASAIPIYQLFVQQAKKLRPRYLVMITPSRWFTSGRGLDNYRKEMLNDDHIREIHDFPDASQCFPGVEIKGGVSYFLWSRDSRGDCRVVNHDGDRVVSEVTRPLIEPGVDTFIRRNEQISILRKVRSFEEPAFMDIVSPNDPFGYDVRVKGSMRRVKPQFKKRPFEGAVRFYYYGWRKDGVGYIERSSMRRGQDLVDAWKLLIPAAWGSGTPDKDWVKPFIVEPNSCATETYLVIGPFADRETCENVLAYTQTKFFHFMVSIVKLTHHAMQKVYSLVPMQDFSRVWTDKELYEKYGLTREEREFIEESIRPMGLPEE